MASNSILANMAVALTANVSDFNRGIAAAKKELAGFRKAGEEMKGFGENLSRYISAPLAGIAAVSLKTFGDLQALQKGLAAVAGSAEGAEKQFKNLKVVAKLPGLGLEEAIQGSINLQAAGFSAEQAEGALKGFGNALATVGKGKAELSGVTTALSQMAAKGKISAEEINQIAERVPQIRKVMDKAFGTSNTEELQKMGISAGEFIDKVTTELNKLPPVSGGLVNSFENLADSGKLAFATLGETISKTFNIEGLLNGIAERLSGIAEAFSNLSPGMQRFIVIGAGVAAAVGPILLAFGAFSAAIPTIVAGATALGAAFTVMTGPIGIAVAAVAVGVALIIKNWDTIKAYFTTGGGAEIFNKLQETIGAAFDRIKAIVIGFVEVAKAIWENYGSTIIATAKFFLTPLINIFKSTFQAIGGLLDFWRAVFEGDWAKVWQSVKNLTAIAVNGIIDMVAGMATALPRLLGGALKGVGLDNTFTKGLQQGVEMVQALADRFKMQTTEVYKSTLAINDNSKALDQIALASDKTAKSYDRQAQALKGLKQHYNVNFGEGIVVAPPKELREGLSLKVDLQPIPADALAAAFDPAKQAALDFASTMGAALQDLIVNDIAALGEALGNLAAGGGVNALDTFFNSVLKSIFDFASLMGKQLILLGIGKEAFDKLFQSIGGGPLAIAAGIALVGAATAARSMLSKGAFGGSGPSASRSASPNYSSKPFTGGDYGAGKVEFKITGDTLTGVLSRRDYRAQRFAG